ARSFIFSSAFEYPELPGAILDAVQDGRSRRSAGSLHFYTPSHKNFSLVEARLWLQTRTRSMSGKREATKIIVRKNDRTPAARVYAAGLLVLVLASVPVFSTGLPPLVDYPNHLARFSLLASGGNSFYAAQWTPLPNLAGDLLVPLLAQLMPPERAGKLFLLPTFALFLRRAVSLNLCATAHWRLLSLLRRPA